MSEFITRKNLSEEKEIRNAVLKFIDFCADFTASKCDQYKGCDTRPLSEKQTEFKKALEQLGPFTHPQITPLIEEVQSIVSKLQRMIERQRNPKMSEEERFDIYEKRHTLELRLKEIRKLVKQEFDELIIEDKTTGQRPTEQPVKEAEPQKSAALKDEVWTDFLKVEGSRITSMYTDTMKRLTENDFHKRSVVVIEPDEWQQATQEIFTEMENEPEGLKDEDLDNVELFKFSAGKEKRDFIRNFLQKSAQNRFPERRDWWGNSENLYNDFRKLTKR